MCINDSIHINIVHIGRVPDCKSIILWEAIFRKSSNGPKIKTGRLKNHQDTRKNRAGEAVNFPIRRPIRAKTRSCSWYVWTFYTTNFPPNTVILSQKLATVLKLKWRDFFSRKNVCEAVFDNMSYDAIVFFSYTTHFHISSCVSKQNHVLLKWNTRELHEQPIHTECITVRCALSRVGIIGPWFSKKMFGH